MHPPSVWNTTAHPVPQLPSLDRDIQTDVAIIGAGYTGLAAARHLARAGVACTVLEAHDVGWGASGRNGGMAVLRYKKPWSVLARELGRERTRTLYRLLHQALDLLEQTVDEFRIDCGFSRCGHITAANGKVALTTLQADIEWLKSEGDTAPRLLDARETAELSGTDAYMGGYLDPRAGGVHPLDYARGHAAGLALSGVPIYVGTAVTSLREESDGVVLETTGGTVRAKQALVATNAYTELHRYGTDLAERVVPVSTSVLTTAPLAGEVARGILREGHLVSDTRHLLNYFRWAPGRRLLYGGRGSLTGKESPDVYRGLEAKLRATFPALQDVAIDHRWSGKVAVTLDDFPHVGRVSPRIAYAMGYGGRGVALTNLLGKLLAHLALGDLIDAGAMNGSGFRRVPLHALRIPAMKVVAVYYGALDAARV
ncbi:MAG TPA: FAD-binding oxidoreductase [Burkholderiales bacterium]|nr:FAD-binding oxidoreductase [Burkholderiales bacterium]